MASGPVTLDNIWSFRSKKKKKTKLPGQPKKPMSAYFMWLNEEGRESIKV